MTLMSSAARCLGLVVLLLGLTTPAAATPAASDLVQAGRWLIDGQGRVITVHGVNMVYKYPPYFPAAGGFGEEDARYLAEHGVNAVRLGFAWKAAEPLPGVYDDDYIARIAQTQGVLAEYGIYSLIDSHQDAFNESVGASWSGFPDWATFTDGFPLQPDPGFPLVYFVSPAQNQTWANFYRNRAAADGVGVRDHYAAMWEHVARRFADEPYVLGYDLINEPWPGWEYPTCFPQGCPRFENDVLAPFQAEVMNAIRRVDSKHVLFYEPSVTNDFGTPNWMPNPTGDPNAGMSFHDYCVGMADACVNSGSDRADREGVVGMVTEFGATRDWAKLTRLGDLYDDRMVSWMLWSLSQNQTPGHPQEPPTGPDLMDPAIVRAYPQAVAGTPLQWRYDSATGAFTLRYRALRVDSGQPFPLGARTEVSLPRSIYPGGYDVDVQGADVVSEPDAPMLELTADPGQDPVTVTVTRR